jgi:hypothetical protein
MGFGSANGHLPMCSMQIRPVCTSMVGQQVPTCIGSGPYPRLTFRGRRDRRLLYEAGWTWLCALFAPEGIHQSSRILSF